MTMGPHVERDELYADGVVYTDGVTPVVEPVAVVQQTPIVQQPLVAGAVAQPVVQPSVAQPVVAAAAPAAPVAAVSRSAVWRFDPAAVITVLFGIALLLFGLVALARAGTDGAWDAPVVTVAGFDHTAILALIEIGAGLVMLAVGFSGWRAASMFFATIIGVGAFVAAVQSSSFDELAIESSFAWLVVIGSIVVILAQAALPTIVDRRAAVYGR
jgi:hypothetical protein